jgi:hypothetical protein
MKHSASIFGIERVGGSNILDRFLEDCILLYYINYCNTLFPFRSLPFSSFLFFLFFFRYILSRLWNLLRDGAESVFSICLPPDLPYTCTVWLPSDLFYSFCLICVGATGESAT